MDHKNEERQYLDLVRHIMDNGHLEKDDRTGVGTKKVHGVTMRFDLSKGHIPLLSTKFIPFRAVIHELLWFLSGSTNIRDLLVNGVTIWSEWPHQKYVRTTGHDMPLKSFEQEIIRDAAFAEQWGSIGPGYGHQWRAWQGPDGKVYDQVSDCLHRLKTEPASRRILFHGWNVADLENMSLPPCHLLYQFFVADGKLSMTMYQRSCDVGLGVPFNIASCAFLVRMMAEQAGLTPGEFFWVGHDAHLYLNHIEPLKEQLERDPTGFPLLTFNRKPPSLFDYKIEDFNLEGYNPQKAIKMDVAV